MKITKTTKHTRKQRNLRKHGSFKLTKHTVGIPNFILTGGSDEEHSPKKGSARSELSPIEYIEHMLTTNRAAKKKSVAYTNKITKEQATFPADNAIPETPQIMSAKIITFEVPEILYILKQSSFYDKIYLPAITEMHKLGKSNKFKWHATNEVHREFGKKQTEKIGQYYTEEIQIVMKKETFYDKTVEELWNWWAQNDEHLYNLLESHKKTYTKPKKITDFPINYRGGGESILDICKTTFINTLSKIINSYIKYGKKEITTNEKGDVKAENKYNKEVVELKQYIELLDSLYAPASLPTYGDLLAVLLQYFKFFSIRLSEFESVYEDLQLPYHYDESIIKSYINQCVTHEAFILPVTMSINYYKTVKAYVIPVVYANIAPSMGHNLFFMPNTNFNHDIIHFLPALNGWQDKLSDNKPFFIGYEKLQDKLKDQPQLLDNLNYLLFSLLHELTYLKYNSEFELGLDDDDINDPMNFMDPLKIIINSLLDKVKTTAGGFNGLLKVVRSKKHVRSPLHDETMKIELITETTDGNLEILGTPEHIKYIPADDFIKAIELIAELPGMQTVK
jgi:hypothetical protein